MSATSAITASTIPASPIRVTARAGGAGAARASPPPEVTPSAVTLAGTAGAAAGALAGEGHRPDANAGPIVLDRPLALQPPANATPIPASPPLAAARGDDSLSGGVRVGALPIAPPQSAVPVHADAQAQALALAQAQTPQQRAPAPAPSGLALALQQGAGGSTPQPAPAAGAAGFAGTFAGGAAGTNATPAPAAGAVLGAGAAEASGSGVGVGFGGAAQRFAPLPPPDPSVPLSPNLTGTWLLDKVRSEPMAAYFRAMGLPELAIEAAAKAEADFDTWNVVEQRDDVFGIKKHGRLIHSCEQYEYAKEYVQTSKIGCKRITVSREGDLVLRQTLLPNDCKLEERRRKLDHSTMHIVFKLTTPGATVVINRYYAKMPPEAFQFSDYD